MPLPLVVDAIEAAPESLRSHYVERDGKFHLDVEGIEDTSGLKSALTKERETARAMTKAVKRWEALGKTPEEVSELLEKMQEDDNKRHKESGNVDAILQQHQTKWEKERADLLARAEAAEGSERAAVVSTQLMGALARIGATEEGTDLLPERLAKRIKYEIEGGARVLRIVQADGETPLAGTGKDGAATFDDLVKEAATKWPSLFKGSGNSGSGTRPNGSNPGAGFKRGAMSAKQKSDYIAAHGQNAFLQLPK